MQFSGHLIKFYLGDPLSEGWRPPVKILDPPLKGIPILFNQMQSSWKLLYENIYKHFTRDTYFSSQRIKVKILKTIFVMVV